MKRLDEVLAGRSALAVMRATALELAERLRREGWEEDERGLWSRGELRGLNLFDAADVRREIGRGP
jgi:hypothetical protein